MTQEVGMKHIEEYHDAGLEPLFAELNSVMPAVFFGEEVFFGEYRLGRPVETLSLKSTDTEESSCSPRSMLCQDSLL